MALSRKAAADLAAKNQLDSGLVAKALEREIAGEAQESEPLRVPFRMGVTLNRSMAHASPFFRALRDRGVFLAGKCPACGHLLFPPMRPVCLICIRRGELVEYRMEELGPEVQGTVAAVSKLVRGTSKDLGKGVQFPCLVRVDRAHNAHWQFVRPDSHRDIRVGDRVRSALKEQGDRTGEVSDYSFVLL